MATERKAVCENVNGIISEATLVLGRGVDSLYLYLDKGIEFDMIMEKGNQTQFEELVQIAGTSFERTRAFMRTYPVSLAFGPFVFYFNRASMYIQVKALGFEMRGFHGCLYWLCTVLDKLAEHSHPWLEILTVSRIDVFADFVYDEDFNPKQFRTRLRARGIFESGKELEGKTYYFGNRSLFCVRLYVKSVEIEKSGKLYLKSQWQGEGYNDRRVWRLEFEFRKRKLDQLTARELIHFDDTLLETLWSYGVDNLEYVDGEASHHNLNKKDLHPLWQDLRSFLFKEYRVLPPEVQTANLAYRWKMARRALVSYYAVKAQLYENIPAQTRSEFEIGQLDHQRSRQKWDWLDDMLLDQRDVPFDEQ